MDEETPEVEAAEEEAPPIPFPSEYVQQKSNLLLEVERFADIVNSIKKTHHIQHPHAINLLQLTLNYNLTLRQMGLILGPEEAEGESDDEG